MPMMAHLQLREWTSYVSNRQLKISTEIPEIHFLLHVTQMMKPLALVIDTYRDKPYMIDRVYDFHGLIKRKKIRGHIYILS